MVSQVHLARVLLHETEVKLTLYRLVKQHFAVINRHLLLVLQSKYTYKLLVHLCGDETIVPVTLRHFKLYQTCIVLYDNCSY